MWNLSERADRPNSVSLIVFSGVLVVIAAAVPAWCEPGGDAPAPHGIWPAAAAVEQPRFQNDYEIVYTEERDPCRDRNPLRNAYFGDLHVHTAYSFDAYGNGTRTTPKEAYDFARGIPIDLPPYDADGRPFAEVSINQPLDFVAITDHAEYFGEMAQCLYPENPGYDTELCRELRIPGPESYVPMAPTIVLPTPRRNTEICGDDGGRCEESISTLWGLTQKAAAEAYDRSENCEFTTFIGYEYSGLPKYRNQHRNIIFRNHRVPPRPISYVEAPREHLLWEQLRAQCDPDEDGCEAISIPHNSNLSNGTLLAGVIGDTWDIQRERAQLRQVTEPLMEIFQHKGNSECMNGLSGILGEPDELCNFEQIRRIGTYSSYKNIFAEVIDCEGEPGFLGLFNGGCVAYNDFFRGASLLGLKEQRRLGVNPLKMGVIAGTDTHVGTAGATDEAGWTGHIVYEITLHERLGSGYLPSNLNGNPGGLAGVWALENSRDAIFDALRRRETFGTSGPRILLRFFGGWDFDSAVCEAPDWVKIGYQRGVPMGGDLPAGGSGKQATFLAYAARDPSGSGAPLQKLQIVKGWIDQNGDARYDVTDLPTPTAASTDGYGELCAVHRDALFDDADPTFYYLRVVQVPTRRWSNIQCAAAGDARPARCGNDAPKVIEELAWSSPIWFTPEGM